MNKEDIRLTPAQRHTLESHWKHTEYLGMAIHDATNQATDKAIRKIVEWYRKEISFLEYINEQLRNTVDGDEHYRKMMVSALNDTKINLKKLVEEK